MNKPLRMLYLENDPQDVFLFEEYLRNENIPYELKIVANENEYTSSLTTETFDVIITDFHLDDIDGFEAIALAGDLARETPLVLFTGSVGEEVAVECIKRGASDYVTKDNPKRLGTAIGQAIEKYRLIREREKADIELQHMIVRERAAFKGTDEVSEQSTLILANDR